jgi:uncharacterized membrane protein HdeD (DUF308 family)
MTETTPQEQVLHDLRSSGTVLIVSGLLSLIGGVLAIFYPDITLLVLALIAGINLVILGIVSLIDAFADEVDVAGRVLAGVLGLLGVIAGLVVMRRPGESLLALLLVLGVWLVVSGVVDLLRAFTRSAARGLRLLSAVCDLALGILILAWPELSLATLAVFVGIAFAVRGILAALLGWQIRRTARSADLPPPQPTGAVPA